MSLVAPQSPKKARRGEAVDDIQMVHSPLKQREEPIELTVFKIQERAET